MKIRFLWDFYGPGAEKTARHFEQHLKDFFKNNELALPTDVQRLEENHWCASCDPPDVPAAMLEPQPTTSDEASIADKVGRALRPQRVEEISTLLEPDSVSEPTSSG